MSKHYHVAKYGSDSYSGSSEYPFLTISKAASLVQPGDTVTVHTGIYREYINPPRGGNDENSRIVFEAASGENVVISGAEIIKSWEKVNGTIYKTVLPNTFFGAFNPYRELVWGDWFDTLERDFHLGEVYINGKSLFEAATLEELASDLPFTKAREKDWSMHKWYCETNETETTIYVNFREFNPSENTVEINVRKFCFWPEQTGINYITVRGFHLTMAAPNWAPPTALQEGLIGPHWSKGWIIEDNEISNSKNSGISLGKEILSGHNEWTLLGTKNGTQRERDVIMNALHHCNWDKKHIGSHIIRNNIIHDCEQTGICGHLGAVFSHITDNHIFNIHHKRMFNGAEVAGIKLHAALDCLIENNCIHNCDRGLWMDWQAQGVRITKNLLFDNDTEDLFVEVSHGPYIVDNNLFFSMKNVRDLSQGGAYLHNLFTGFLTWTRVTNRFTPYHYAHETGVRGFMTILGGDNRFYNNIFTGTQKQFETKEKSIDNSIWMNFDVKTPGEIQPKGLCIYNDCPAEDEDFYHMLHTVDEFATMRIPMHCGSNLYFGDAVPFRKEIDSMTVPSLCPQVVLDDTNGDISINVDFEDYPSTIIPIPITTDFLGIAFEPELPYENPDGTPFCIETDFFGQSRNPNTSCIGPFSNMPNGPQKIHLAKIKYSKERSQ
ncbi:MAG: right-handed parallel beta-helix repeat-containing protein [Lachnospiraceae bacterium]|nr:right-handed parallel beta-helix repeat-containing protein [Lachnospiraceae bacterium]